MKNSDVKHQVRELLERLPDDCSLADVQRAIALLARPEPQGPVAPEEVRRRLREWLKSEKGE